MYISESLQEKYFLDLIETKKPVVVYLRTGRKFQGTLMSLTQDLLFIKTPGIQTFRRSQVRTIIPVNA